MSCDTTWCVTVRCDRCLVIATDTTGRPRHWTDLEQALTDLTAPTIGWQATQSSQICQGHALAGICQSVGHDWDHWQPLNLPDLAAGEVIFRFCLRCDRSDARDVAAYVQAVSTPVGP